MALTEIAHLVRSTESGSAPRRRVRADALVELIEKHTDLLFEQAYGEEKHVRDLAVALGEMGSELAEAKTIVDLKARQATGPWTVDDLLFLNDFLNWYVRWLIDENLDSRRLYTLKIGQLQGDSFQIAGVAIPDLRLMLIDGQPIYDFVEYLGYID